jgi:hypothetical protein
MKMTQNVAIVLLLLILAAIAGVGFYSLSSDRRTPPEFACTMDALVCPDGAAVGRTGPSCSFAPCPSKGQLSGQYLSDAQGTRLIVPAKDGVGVGVTYAVPLEIGNVVIPKSLIGKEVTLIGNFVVGNTFAATALASTTSEGTERSSGEAVIAVGESKLIGGVKITVNKVVSDSRCPIDVQCIRAGEITASVTLQSDTDKETLELASNMPPHGFDAYQVSLTGVTPEKRSSTAIDTTGYRLTFKVEKLGQ